MAKSMHLCKQPAQPSVCRSAAVPCLFPYRATGKEGSSAKCAGKEHWHNWRHWPHLRCSLSQLLLPGHGLRMHAVQVADLLLQRLLRLLVRLLQGGAVLDRGQLLLQHGVHGNIEPTKWSLHNQPSTRLGNAWYRPLMVFFDPLSSASSQQCPFQRRQQTMLSAGMSART